MSKIVACLLALMLVTIFLLPAIGCDGWAGQSVQGPLGPQGPIGPQGPPGPQGPQGPGGDEGFILDKSVTSTKIASSAVTSSKIQDGTVDTRDLGDEAVTTDKIDDGAVTSDKIADGAIDTSKIAVGAVMPKGSILMWSGTIDGDGYPVIDGEPDTNWHICDGTGGTPDLTDRFIIGAGGAYAVGDTGGSDSQTLTVANMPEHNHDFSATTSEQAHDHWLWEDNFLIVRSLVDDIGFYILVGANYLHDYRYTRTEIGGEHTHNVSGTTDSTGNSDSFSIMPPYYALAYIMYIPE